MEREFFDWDNWDGDEECMNFYGVVLKVQIGEYPVGTKFGCAIITQNQRSGKAALAFYNGGMSVAEFELHYRVGEKLS